MNIQTVLVHGTAPLTAYIADGEVGYRQYRKRPGIILAPGGAYLMHATREKEGAALEFVAKGYNVFLLEYSLGFSSREVKESGRDTLDTDHRFPLPLLELLEAIHSVKANADAWNTDPARLFLLGFSAGGHLCASAGVFWNTPAYTSQLSFTPQGDELKAAGMVLGYPMLSAHTDRVLDINRPGTVDAGLVMDFMYQTRTPSQEQIDALDLTKHVTRDTVPAFIWHSVDDPVVDARASTKFILALQNEGINCEYHLFERGGHGLGLANKVYAHSPEEILPDLARWTTLADNWMSLRGTG